MRRLGDHSTMEELKAMLAEVDQVEDIIGVFSLAILLAICA
jgi:hypothetical protein